MLKKLRQLKINRIVVYLTLSDIFAWSGFLISSALIGIYLEHKIGGETIKYVGIGIAIYYLVRSLLQLPIGLLTDRISRDRDEILFSFAGITLMGISYMFYPYLKNEWHFYGLQFVYAMGASMYLICWRTLFAKNLNKDNEGLEYGVYETFFGLATAGLSILAGMIANMSPDYFSAVIRGLGILTILGNTWIVMIYWAKERKSRKG